MATLSTPSSRKKKDPIALNSFIEKRFQAANYASLTKEEKLEWRRLLAKNLNTQRFTDEVWTEASVTKKLSNLGIRVKTPKPTGQSHAVPAPSRIIASTNRTSVLEQFFYASWKHLISCAEIAHASFAHASDKGTTNELFLKNFLQSNLASSRVAVGSGEILIPPSVDGTPENTSSSTVPRRQYDIILYAPHFPKLTPPTSVGEIAAISLFFVESVIAVLEVKTTLSNDDMIDAASAASVLAGAEIPCMLVAFDSQVSLSATNTQPCPVNLQGIYNLHYGTLLQGVDGWSTIGPSTQNPLLLLYCALNDAVQNYYCLRNNSRLDLERYMSSSSSSSSTGFVPVRAPQLSGHDCNEAVVVDLNSGDSDNKENTSPPRVPPTPTLLVVHENADGLSDEISLLDLSNDA